MFAHQITGFTGPDDVRWTEVDEPPADGGVLIDVVAAGVSFADLLQTTPRCATCWGNGPSTSWSTRSGETG